MYTEGQPQHSRARVQHHERRMAGKTAKWGKETHKPAGFARAWFQRRDLDAVGPDVKPVRGEGAWHTERVTSEQAPVRRDRKAPPS